ncbi:tRNA lysidine(34) synthetase TilS [Salinispirillum marinum]|uniref:tRNA(Ile)-lysidine synthase n=2 Tax=Saccharospirillaceae TaxID=255527 RepID=A0ABV8BIZ5_9GAMM
MSLSVGPHATSLLDLLNHARADAAPRIWVAYSGGMDSSVLAALAVKRWPDKVALLHVNHQLQPVATDWVAHCQRQADEWRVPFVAVKVTVDMAARSAQGVEGAARSARYAAFAQHVATDQVLLMAHHADDQVETVLYRLLRGAGPDGLAGMSEFRPLETGGQVWRPWLTQPRTTLQAAATELGLTWVEDPTNAQAEADRNFLRHRVLPVIEERWPQYRATLERARTLQAQAAHQLQTFWQPLVETRQQGDGLRIDDVMAWPEADQMALLRTWLADFAPSYQQLRALIHTVLPAAPDASPQVVLGPVSVRRYQQALYIVSDQPAPPEHHITLSLTQSASHPAFGRVCLSDTQTDEDALVLPLEWAQRSDLSVDCRRGGERFHPYGRQGSRDLKRLLQEWGIPPWQRDRIPLVYAGTELIAVGLRVVGRGWVLAQSLDRPDR